jgi:GNAT superfamily N-acetyltransferase
MAAVRKATVSDLDSLAVLFDKYRIFYGKPTDIKGATAFLKERLENKDSEIFVSQDGDTLTGFVQLYPLFSSTRLKKLWLLNDLFVDQQCRGKGFSKALIDESKKLCRATNACALMLETAKTNVIGNNLYPSTGFVLEDHSNFYEWACD